MKKMTQKEFFKALEESGHYARSFEEVLNVIACDASYKKRDAIASGFDASARMYEKVQMNIYDILDARGFYDK